MHLITGKMELFLVSRIYSCNFEIDSAEQSFTGEWDAYVIPLVKKGSLSLKGMYAIIRNACQNNSRAGIWI